MTEVFTRGQIETALRKMRMGTVSINLVLNEAARVVVEDDGGGALTWDELQNYYNSTLEGDLGRMSEVKAFVLRTRVSGFPDNTVVRDAIGVWYRKHSDGWWEQFGRPDRVSLNIPVRPLEVMGK